MKINHRIILVALAAGLLSASPLLAQDNRIAASPKVQAQLAERQAMTKVTAPALAHRCADCTDSIVSVVDKATKGGKAIASQVVQHNCAACDTKIVSKGTGKATHDVAVHYCKSETKPMCCAAN